MSVTEAIYRNQQTVEQFKASKNASHIDFLDTEKTYKNSTVHKLMFSYGPDRTQSGYIAQSLSTDIQNNTVDTKKQVVFSEISQDGGNSWVLTLHYKGEGGYKKIGVGL